MPILGIVSSTDAPRQGLVQFLVQSRAFPEDPGQPEQG